MQRSAEGKKVERDVHTVQHNPRLVVTDDLNGWSLTGGRQRSDGSSTKEMTHINGARCTMMLSERSREPDCIVLAVTGVVYLNPGEARGTYLLKPPQPGDSITAVELYAIIERLLRAWFAARFKKMAPLKIEFPRP